MPLRQQDVVPISLNSGSVDISTIMPDLPRAEYWIETILGLEEATVTVEVANKENHLSGETILAWIKDAQREYQQQGWDGDFSVDEVTSLNGLSSDLIREIRPLILEFGTLKTDSQREAFCRAMSRRIKAFFKAGRKTRHVGTKLTKTRRKDHLRGLAQATQRHLGALIDQRYDFSAVRFDLYPFSTVPLELADMVERYQEKPGVEGERDALRHLLTFIENGLRAPELQLRIEDVFERPERYDDFYRSLGDNGNLKHVRALYAYASAMTHMADSLIPQRFLELEHMEIMQELVPELRTRTWDSVDVVLSGSPSVASFEYDGVSPWHELAPYYVEECEAEGSSSEEAPETIAEGIGVQVAEALEPHTAPEGAEFASYRLPRKDLVRLVRFLIWGRNNPATQIAQNLNRFSKGAFKWRPEHIVIPQALADYAQAVYEHPATQGSDRFKYLSFYVRMWIENADPHYFTAFHPEVLEAIQEWTGAESCSEDAILSDTKLTEIDRTLDYSSFQ